MKHKGYYMSIVKVYNEYRFVLQFYIQPSEYEK